MQPNERYYCRGADGPEGHCDNKRNTIQCDYCIWVETQLSKKDTDDDEVGACHALWLYNRQETDEVGEWNGDRCACQYIQGNLNCKLNPY